MTLLVILLNIEGGANTKTLAKEVKAGIRNDEKNHSRTIGFSLNRRDLEHKAIVGPFWRAAARLQRTTISEIKQAK